MAKVDDFHRVGELLGDACDAATSSRRDTGGEDRIAAEGGPRRDAARMVADAWADIAGPEVAANARPVQLKRGRLVVSASSSAWAHALQDMGEELKERLNERIGQDAVQGIVFRHAGWEERSGREQGAGPRPKLARGRALSQEELEALARLEELDLPAGLRERIARAMKATFVRGGQNSVR